MRACLIALFLLLPASALADNTLYTHCLQDWSAQALGEVCFAWAEDQGLPTYGGPEEQTSTRAFAFCERYFVQYLGPRIGVGAAITCRAFAQDGASLIAGW